MAGVGVGGGRRVARPVDALPGVAVSGYREPAPTPEGYEPLSALADLPPSSSQDLTAPPPEVVPSAPNPHFDSGAFARHLAEIEENRLDKKYGLLGRLVAITLFVAVCATYEACR